MTRPLNVWNSFVPVIQTGRPHPSCRLVISIGAIKRTFHDFKCLISVPNFQWSDFLAHNCPATPPSFVVWGWSSRATTHWVGDRTVSVIFVARPCDPRSSWHENEIPTGRVRISLWQSVHKSHSQRMDATPQHSTVQTGWQIPRENSEVQAVCTVQYKKTAQHEPAGNMIQTNQRLLGPRFGLVVSRLMDDSAFGLRSLNAKA